MNLTTMLSVVGHLVDDPNEDTHNSTKKTTFINIAKDWVASQLESLDEDFFVKSEDISVTAVTDNSNFTATLSNDYGHTVKLERVVTNERPTPLEYRTFRRTDLPSSESEGVGGRNSPIVSIYATTLAVVAPSQAFTLRHWYASTVADMASGADTPTGIPSNYHYLLCLYAAKQVLGTEQREVTQVAFIDNEVEKRLAGMKAAVKPRQRWQTRTVHEEYDHRC